MGDGRWKRDDKWPDEMVVRREKEDETGVEKSVKMEARRDEGGRI
jgi:hypothetical protein